MNVRQRLAVFGATDYVNVRPASFISGDGVIPGPTVPSCSRGLSGRYLSLKHRIFVSERLHSGL
ncbi:unnamed protein product [Oppiella nova]|uniref:Uncharacterized protein n=1 Tax=Oppiella nova TaxID=334625 RepID=A0A7R9QEL8_9ACAR|nr:unnamed protein product [Oppiella nova]CAG2163810.1 unnamed protein product [Oppiella nova]